MMTTESIHFFTFSMEIDGTIIIKRITQILILYVILNSLVNKVISSNLVFLYLYHVVIK